MGEHLAIEQRMAEALIRWPGIQLKRNTADWASGPCPWCGGDDRFVVRSSSWYSCRKCLREGWIDENDPTPPDPVKLLEARLAAVEREQQEQAKRLSALERMARSRDHIAYYEQMNADGYRDYWLGEGMTDATIDKYHLGACYGCPTDKAHRFSFTIPVINGGVLRNIRHRLIGGDPGDKYRPHTAGLGNTLMLGDNVHKDDTSSILILEGEKKALCVSQEGYSPVGIMGKGGFQKHWVPAFDRFDEIIVALDPDAEERASKLASWFGKRGRVATLPVKVDEFFFKHKGTRSQFNEFLRMARVVH